MRRERYMSAEDIERQQSTAGPTLPMRPQPGYGPKHVPPDIERQYNNVGNRAARTDVTGGGAMPTQESIPVVPIGTEPVYDTLPANAGKLNETQQFTVDATLIPPGVGIAVNQSVFLLEVPQGRVLYTRDIRVNIIDSTTANDDEPPVQVSIGIPPGLFSFSLVKNRGADVFNQSIEVEPLDNYNPIFLIGAPGDIVEVMVNFDYSDLIVVPNFVTFLVHLRGEYLTPNRAAVPYTALLKPGDK
jgi:hypothetical protein